MKHNPKYGIHRTNMSLKYTPLEISWSHVTGDAHTSHQLDYIGFPSFTPINKKKVHTLMEF